MEDYKINLDTYHESKIVQAYVKIKYNFTLTPEVDSGKQRALSLLLLFSDFDVWEVVFFPTEPRKQLGISGSVDLFLYTLSVCVDFCEGLNVYFEDLIQIYAHKYDRV